MAGSAPNISGQNLHSKWIIALPGPGPALLLSCGHWSPPHPVFSIQSGERGLNNKTRQSNSDMHVEVEFNANFPDIWFSVSALVLICCVVPVLCPGPDSLQWFHPPINIQFLEYYNEVGVGAVYSEWPPLHVWLLAGVGLLPITKIYWLLVVERSVQLAQSSRLLLEWSDPPPCQ